MYQRPLPPLPAGLQYVRVSPTPGVMKTEALPLNMPTITGPPNPSNRQSILVRQANGQMVIIPLMTNTAESNQLYTRASPQVLLQPTVSRAVAQPESQLKLPEQPKEISPYIEFKAPHKNGLAVKILRHALIPIPYKHLQAKTPEKPKGTLVAKKHDQWYNMNEVVVQNIMHTKMWRFEINMKVYTIEEWKDGVQEKVKHLGAITWDKRPSVAWCFLYKLCLLEPSQEVVEDLIDYDQPVVLRGIVFIYLRMVAVPKRLWFWFSRYLHEKTPLLQDHGVHTTLGEFLVSMLKENKFVGSDMDIPLPRIPVPVHRAYRKKIYMLELIEEENKPFKWAFKPSVEVLGLYHDDQQYYPAVIREVLENGNYVIDFKEYSTEQEVSLGQIKWIGGCSQRSSPSSSPIPPTIDRWSSAARCSENQTKSKSVQRSRSRSRSRSREQNKAFHSVDVNYEDLESFAEKLIRKEDSNKQSASNSRGYSKRLPSECSVRTMFESAPSKFRSPLVVDLQMNRQVVRVQPRGKKNTKKDRAILLEQERERARKWKPSTEHRAKMKKLKDRYG